MMPRSATILDHIRIMLWDQIAYVVRHISCACTGPFVDLPDTGFNLVTAVK